ncbi:MAG: ATP-dependent Lon protease, partial [Chloroflexota bacterium]|nr:ATP-dependent Lon protease [Chloroflexota bacterium]
MFTSHVGFILDYTSELFHRELRRIGNYGMLWERWFEAPLGQWSARDMRSINRTFSGLTKLIFPSGVMEKEDARMLLELAMELRLRV